MCKPRLMELGVWFDPSLWWWLFPPMLIMAPIPPHLGPWKLMTSGSPSLTGPMGILSLDFCDPPAQTRDTADPELCKG